MILMGKVKFSMAEHHWFSCYCLPKTGADTAFTFFRPWKRKISSRIQLILIFHCTVPCGFPMAMSTWSVELLSQIVVLHCGSKDCCLLASSSMLFDGTLLSNFSNGSPRSTVASLSMTVCFMSLDVLYNAEGSKDVSAAGVGWTSNSSSVCCWVWDV